MKYAFDYKTLVPGPKPPRIVTIGNYDGVHVGHQTVLAKARGVADRLNAELAVLTFEPHPAELLKPSGPKLRLVEPDRKTELLAECGADLVLAQRFDREFAEVSAELFARDVLKAALCAKVVIVGENFRFGQGRQGDVSSLVQLGCELGFEVRGHELVKQDGEEVSSSRIRDLLQRGDVARAGKMLGRLHEVPGRVVKGFGRGASLGFPTINLDDVQVLAPGPGIYAAHCIMRGRSINAAAYIGNRPTMNLGFSVEAHLLDFAENLYDERVALRFVEKVRGEKKFSSEQALAQQMSKDVAQIRDLFSMSNG